MSRLTSGAELAWNLAAAEAHAAGAPFIEREHLLIGLCGLERAVLLGTGTKGLGQAGRQAALAEHDGLKKVLALAGLEPEALSRRLKQGLPRGSQPSERKVVSRSPAVKAVFAAAEAAAANSPVTALQLLASLARDPGSLVLPGLAEKLAAAAPAAPLAKPSQSCLDRYGRDLTREAREGKLGPFVGRREELLQLIQTLARRSKNNPVLVGEAGVGKTAIVEALAVRAAEGKDAAVLGGKRIVELSLGALVGGTKMRGEFEERLTRIIAEAKEDRDLIVFIDELHTVLGAGSVKDGSGAEDLLKPALARGDFRCIGATTTAEYRRFIESDPAFERRFERIEVLEPGREDTLAMLKGTRPRWEQHHGVSIEDGALEAAVDLSMRFDGDHRLPDKAFDLVDKAAARLRLPSLSAVAPRPEAVSTGKLAAAVPVLTAGAIAELLALKTGLPLSLLAGQLGDSGARLSALEPWLNERVIGQEEAVGAFCRRLIMAHCGLSPRRGPLAVFLLLGPTGVGKTQLVRSAAEFLFGSEGALIRLDMSEFMEEHSAAKLIGSPPGYVGYQEEGQLTGKLRSRPYSLLLLDEVEKAHPRVLDLFLQLFDEGRLTDAKGRTVDARNVIVAMTSNLGAQASGKGAIGFRDPSAAPAAARRFREEAAEAVRQRFRPEMLNRIDEQVVFAAMTEESVRRILRPMLAAVSRLLKDQRGAELIVEPRAEGLLAEAGYSPVYGVRELGRVVDRLLREPLSALVVSGKAKKGLRVKVSAAGKALSFEVTA